MSLLICPECRNKVSEYAEDCPKCGCPIHVIKEMNQKMINDLPDQLKCCVCGCTREKNTYILNDYKCRVCGTDIRLTLEELKKEEPQNPVQPPTQTYQQQNPNIPRCPTCGSTNIHKISATQKALGYFGFGIMSKTAKSQFECRHCGYKW